jgi:chemotaxis protein methyltransferase WspC
MKPSARDSSADVPAVTDDAAVPAPVLTAVGEQLRTTIGLDVERLGEESVARAIRCVWPDAAGAGAGTEGGQLTAMADGWQRLIEAIVVSESWFLREPKIFNHAVHVVERILRQQPQATILSGPCAAGEEAYSLSLSLLQAGVPADCFRIVAADISERAIAAARRGVYTDNAFRATDASLCDRWFTQTPEGWDVRSQVRQPVTFITANLLDPHDQQRLLTAAAGHFDLICCRNLLIYLTTAARQTMENSLQLLLAAEGEVIVGAAEATIMPVSRWQPTGPLAFGRRARPPSAIAAKPAARGATLRRRPPDQPPPPPAPADKSSPVAQSASAVRSSASPHPVPSLPDPLVEAEGLANSGDIAAAISRCQQALDANPAQPALLFLEAVLLQSQGASAAAERLLEKVVYLEPNHEGALLALALAAGRRGDTAAERRYRRRAAAAAESDS